MKNEMTEIVRRVQNGDEEAFHEIVKTWRRRILGMVARLIGRPDDAEDVAQEVFVRVYYSLDKLREPSQFEPWLYRLATNAALDYLRRHKRVRVRVSDLAEERLFAIERAVAMRDALDQQHQQEMRDYANYALSVLSEEDRTLLMLKEVEGLSVKELCQVYDLGEEAVKVRLFRARKKVVKRLTKNEGNALTLPFRAPAAAVC